MTKQAIRLFVVISMTFAIAPVASAGWQYNDTENRIMVSGAVCRAADGAGEYNVYHYPGSTSVGSWVTSQVLFCPANRRNLHSYAKNLSNFGETVLVDQVWVKVNSPSGNAKCRLFGKDRNSASILYSPWTTPFPSGLGVYIFFSWGVSWESVNWGVMCDIPGGESILNVEVHVRNNNL